VSAFARVSSLPIPDPDPDPDPDSWEAFIDGAAAGRAGSAPLGSPTAEPAGEAGADGGAAERAAAGAAPGGAGDAAAAAADTGARCSRLGRRPLACCWAALPAPADSGCRRLGCRSPASCVLAHGCRAVRSGTFALGGKAGCAAAARMLCRGLAAETHARTAPSHWIDRLHSLRRRRAGHERRCASLSRRPPRCVSCYRGQAPARVPSCAGLRIWPALACTRGPRRITSIGYLPWRPQAGPASRTRSRGPAAPAAARRRRRAARRRSRRRPRTRRR